MSSRLIFKTEQGHEVHSSIFVESIVILYKDGTSICQTPLDFTLSNPLYNMLTDRELKKLIKETEKKVRYKRNKLNLTND